MNYGLIGEHLSHSFSKEIHSIISDYDYELIELKQEDLDLFFKKRDFCGINVTIPYKEKVIKYLDFISDEAKEIGAINTIINNNGKLYGYNTDYSGFIDLVKKINVNFTGKKVLILGTGGTSKTVFFAVKGLGAKDIYKVSRKKGTGFITYSEAENQHFDTDIIINTTPVGMYPKEEKIPINLNTFTNLSAIIDVIYNPIRTDFVISGKEKEIISVGGLYMLVSQALRSSSLFKKSDSNEKNIGMIYSSVLRNKCNIVLIGMPTCGKSSVGKIIAEKLNKTFLDSDEIIEKSEKKSITNIFSEFGETYFREAERKIISEISKKTNSVISVGGGAVLNNENVRNLKKDGILFFIERCVEKLTPKEDRPLSNNDNALRKLFFERYETYRMNADFIIDGNGTIEDTTANILEVISDENFDY